MKIAPGTPLRVAFDFDRGAVPVPVGRLAFDAGRALLEYDGQMIASALRMNPLHAPSAALYEADATVFDGLHGAIADSLPDAWGDLLIRRRAAASGIAYSSLTPLDRLAIIGSRGMGALVYAPEIAPEAVGGIDLDEFADAAAAVEEGAPTERLAELARLGGSSGGARPKVLVGMNEAGELLPGDVFAPGYEAWLVKFRSRRFDAADIGLLEAAYADMARDAGVEISQTRILASVLGPGYFATRRFDRPGGTARLHVVSFAGATDVPWDRSGLDYRAALRLVRAVTRDQREVEQMFARMAFNVVAHNRDDHAKQHAFLMDARGMWRLAPAYDLTFSRGYQTGVGSSQHYLAVGGRGGDDITRALVIGEGVAAGLDRIDCDAIYDRVLDAVGSFATYAAAYRVSAATSEEVRSVLDSSAARLKT